MELKNKDLTNARYRVTCENGNYTITGEVAINGEGNVTTMYECLITNNEGVFVSSFSQYGEELHVNYGANLTTKEKQSILVVIEDFKNAVIK